MLAVAGTLLVEAVGNGPWWSAPFRVCPALMTTDPDAIRSVHARASYCLCDTPMHLQHRDILLACYMGLSQDYSF